MTGNDSMFTSLEDPGDHEGFFLSYASNSKAYRVFNQTSGLVEETCDVEFDKSNGSQEEVVGYENVGDEEIDEVLKNMSIGDIKPEEVHEGNDQGGGPSSCGGTTQNYWARVH